MKSMTGHGRGEASTGPLRVVAECFSVNRKQAEVSLSTARELLWMEPHVRDFVIKRVARGKVQVSVAVERGSTGHIAQIDHERAAAFLNEARSLRDKLGLTAEVGLETILAAPGVLKTDDIDSRDLWPHAEKALGLALEGLLEMRAIEGDHLQKELAGSLQTMRDLLAQVKELAPAVPGRQRESLLRRLQTAQLPIDILDARLLTEIAFFAERCDISEELARLESHYNQFADNLKSDAPVGRTLEFLAQEVGREWNTIGSKANDAEISRLVVAAKVELDRVREQLANIE